MFGNMFGVWKLESESIGVGENLVSESGCQNCWERDPMVLIARDNASFPDLNTTEMIVLAIPP